MKNLPIAVLSLILPMFFACQKEEPLQLDAFDSHITVTYSLNVLGDADLAEVRFLGPDNQWKTVTAPSAYWQYQMIVEKGFVAKMEVSGTFPDSGQNSVTLNITGESEHGHSTRNSGHMAIGDFLAKLELELTGE